MDFINDCQYSVRLMDKLCRLNEKSKDKINLSMVDKAIYYAKKYHGAQTRESGEPYYSHPLEVAYLISDYLFKPHHLFESNGLFKTNIIITSILHDTIEDTAITKEIITSIFGDQIASNVEELTRNKPNYKITSAKMIESLSQQRKYGLTLIKIFDRIHNLKTIEAKSPQKARKIIEETIGSFITPTIQLEEISVEKELTTLCYQLLSDMLPKEKTLSRRRNFLRETLSRLLQIQKID
jgi:(p)ppGpp synthase/HD superfamily hydrolase